MKTCVKCAAKQFRTEYGYRMHLVVEHGARYSTLKRRRRGLAAS